MARVVLGVTGSVAAIRTPELFQTLRAAGHVVRVVTTEPALHFFDPAALGPPQPDAAPCVEGRIYPGGPVYRDADEWPEAGYRRGNPVWHVEFRKWAEVLVVAPLDAHTLAKCAYGLCDNFLTCLLRAWDFTRPVVLAPAMNTLMWESPVTLRHFRILLETFGDGRARLDHLDQVSDVFAAHCPGIVIVPPQAKRLACGDVGVGAMAEVPAIAEAVRAWADRAEGNLY